MAGAADLRVLCIFWVYIYLYLHLYILLVGERRVFVGVCWVRGWFGLVHVAGAAHLCLVRMFMLVGVDMVLWRRGLRSAHSDIILYIHL